MTNQPAPRHHEPLGRRNRLSGALISITIYGLIVAGAGIAALTSCSTGEAPEVRQVRAEPLGTPVISQPTVQPSPTASPTMDAELVARATRAAVDKAEAEAALARSLAEQEALRVSMAQAAATMTALPIEATQIANRVAVDAATATALAAPAAAATAYAPTQAALDHAQAVEPLYDAAQLIGVFVAFLLAGLVVWYAYWRFRLTISEWRFEIASNESGILQMTAEREHAEPAAQAAPEFSRTSSGSYVRKPSITTKSERAIAAYVVRTGQFHDAMRNGDGIGCSWEVYEAYRDYLVSLGVLEVADNGYVVARPEYFRARAAG